MHRRRSRGATAAATLALTPVLCGNALPHHGLSDRAALTMIEQIGSGNNTQVSQVGIDQIADPRSNNRAFVSIVGHDNGTGMIAGMTVESMVAFVPGKGRGVGHRYDGTDDAHGGHASGGKGKRKGHGHHEPADPLEVPQLASGVVRQEGRDNLALVAIRGNENDFHVTQIGEDNSAIQVVFGTENAVATVQGSELTEGDGNFAFQLQAGAGNYAYAGQYGDGNVAKQIQVGPLSALLATLHMTYDYESALAHGANSDPGSSNVSLLEQNGANNLALTIQAGSDNLIALRQPGNALAVITQVGSGHSVTVEQSAGANGVTPLTITQFGGF